MPIDHAQHLAQADHYIARAKQHIARQHALIVRFEQTGHATNNAEHMLEIMEGTLRCYEAHRRLIVWQMDGWARFKMDDAAWPELYRLSASWSISGASRAR